MVTLVEWHTAAVIVSPLSATIYGLNRSYAAQGCEVASLTEGMAASVIQHPLLARAGIWNFVHGAGDGFPTLHGGHHGMFNAHKGMLADGIPI